MKKKFKVVVVGLGNVGKKVKDELLNSPDLEFVGVIRRSAKEEGEYSSIEELIKQKGKPDIAILCGPSENVPNDAEKYLQLGISTVDSYDKHANIEEALARLTPIAKQNDVVAIIGSGWDPGLDSIIRSLLMSMCPSGKIFTTFGPGMSMGHSVAARSVKGIVDAVSITLPRPRKKGLQNREVYAVVEAGVTYDEIYAALKENSYFSKDPLDLHIVDKIDEKYLKPYHKVKIEVKDENLNIVFSMKMESNPTTTARSLVSAARAASRHYKSGAFTVIDIPPVNFLPGERLEHVNNPKLV